MGKCIARHFWEIFCFKSCYHDTKGQVLLRMDWEAPTHDSRHPGRQDTEKRWGFQTGNDFRRVEWGSSDRTAELSLSGQLKPAFLYPWLEFLSCPGFRRTDHVGRGKLSLKMKIKCCQLLGENLPYLDFSGLVWYTQWGRSSPVSSSDCPALCTLPRPRGPSRLRLAPKPWLCPLTAVFYPHDILSSPQGLGWEPP